MKPVFILAVLSILPGVGLTEALQSEQLPPYVLLWPESIQRLLVADAKTSTLMVFSRDGSELKVSEMSMSVGRRGIDKQREGDRRTPLGVYFITEQLDTSDLDPIYGITAFPIDYPNARDRQAGRDGGGIWLHGVEPGSGRRPALDTDGCLAISNEALALLAPTLVPQTTPVIIARSISARPADRDVVDLANTIEGAVGDWLVYRQSGNTRALARLYVDDYQSQGLTKQQWIQFWAADAPNQDSPIDELFIAADPEEEGVYVSRFRLRSGGAAIYKRLYWQRQRDGHMRIVAEDEW